MTNKLEIDRELAELTIAALQEEGRWDVADRIEASLCAPVVERQEPVAWRFRVSDSSDWFTTTRKDVAEMFRNSSDGSHSEPLYAEQPAPVASNNLRNFANAMIDIALEGADADGAHIQELAIKHGLLKPEQRTERCGDTCSCAEYADFPVECFRKVKELNQ